MAKQKPFRCQNPACSTDHAGRLIFDFWADKPVCPKCGTDSKTMPHVVIELSVVHFDPPSKVEGRGLRILACTKRGYGGGESVTGCPSAVNCRECIASPEWQKIAEERGIDPPLMDIDRIPEALEFGGLQIQRIKAELEAAAA